jgi:hypothetical protein
MPRQTVRHHYDPTRRTRSTLCLIALAILTVAGACNDRSSRPSPTGPSGQTPAPIPTAFYTAPVEGVVREVGGGPVAGQEVTFWGAARSVQTISDGAGRFRFESVEILPDRFPHITAYRQGFVAGALDVPVGLQRPETLSAELRLQPHLTLHEGTPLRITLSNDDLDYGAAWEPDFNLPGERGPVKVVAIESTTDGPHALRAQWSTADRLHLWAEIYYKEESFAASGDREATLLLPRRWTRDPLNGVIVTVGLPRSARATGGLTGAVDVTLTLVPAYASP